MKGLSIEQKAKAYDEALEKAKEYYKDCKQRGNLWFVEDMEDMFPELKESEDEKTKRLLHTIANKISQHLRDIFTEEEFQCFDAWSNAWLEKQGEQKEVNYLTVIHIGKSYKCIAVPRYTSFQLGKTYKPEDVFARDLMNLCAPCFKEIDEKESKVSRSLSTL